jgi:hypothetical protein
MQIGNGGQYTFGAQGVRSKTQIDIRHRCSHQYVAHIMEPKLALFAHIMEPKLALFALHIMEPKLALFALHAQLNPIGRQIRYKTNRVRHAHPATIKHMQ